MDRSLNVPGLPELKGQYNPARVAELERISLKIQEQILIETLAEREKQLADVIEKLRQRS